MKLPGRKTYSKRQFVVGAGVLAIVAVVVAATWWLDRSPVQQTPSNEQSFATHTQSQSLHFAAMGDMLAHDSVVANAKTDSGYDFTTYFARVRHMYQQEDVVFCNPETAAAGEAYGVSGYPTFNAPTEFARDLNKEGCNLINLATNHIADKGQPALDATLDVWQRQRILAVSGANRSVDEQNTVAYFTKNALRVAFVAFADFSNNQSVTSYGLNTYHNHELVTSLLGEARKNADVVVVSAHWGTEDSTTVNDDQRAAAALFASLGADVVIGTGPHVLQTVERLARPDGGKTLVWYSLGNFLSSQLEVNQLTGGVAEFTVTKNGTDVTVSDVMFQPTFMAYDWPVADRQAGRLSTRTHLALYPLDQAGERLAAFNITVKDRQQFVRDTLGDEVKVVN